MTVLLSSLMSKAQKYSFNRFSMYKFFIYILSLSFYLKVSVINNTANMQRYKYVKFTCIAHYVIMSAFCLAKLKIWLILNKIFFHCLYFLTIFNMKNQQYVELI